MGFFGGSSKPADQTDTQSLQDGHEDSYSDIPELPEPRTDTVIAKDITVTGTLSGEGVVQIEGTLEGEVKLKGYVIVTASGVIHGPIEADVIRIAGKVEGNVTALDHLQLERTGSIKGDVASVSFVIENGGRLNGRSTMIEGHPTSPRVEQLPEKAEKETELV